MKFVIEGEPHAKLRPKTSYRSGNVYTDPKDIAYEKEVAKAFIIQCGSKTKFAGYVDVGIKAYMKIPKSATKAKRAQMAQGIIRPLRKDVDNIAKSILDGLNKIAWEDDKLVYRLTIEKYYAEEPRVEVELIGVEA